jgi:hypothetical protein
MILGISNLIYAKNSKNWRILEIKKTPVNKITGKYLNYKLGGGGEVKALLVFENNKGKQ